MVSELPTRRVVKDFIAAGWDELRSDGRHTVYGCPCGKHRFALPDSHRMISPGIVRKAFQALNDCKEGRA